MNLHLDIELSGPFFTRGPQAVRQALDRGARDAAEFGATQARGLFVPGRGLHTGRLRGSVSFERRRDREFEFGTNMTYGPFVEFGTPRFRGQHQLRMAAQRADKRAGDFVRERIKRERL